MARFRIDLQPATNVTSDARQPGNEAILVGNARSGVAVVNVFKVQASGVVTFSIETASDLVLGDASPGTFWMNAGTIVVPTTGPSAQTIEVSNLAYALRWRVAGVTSEFAFSCVLFLTDQ